MSSTINAKSLHRGAVRQTGPVITLTLAASLLLGSAAYAQAGSGKASAQRPATDFSRLPEGPLPKSLYRYGIEPRVIQEPPLTRLAAPPPPAITTAAEGARVRSIALAFVGISPYRFGGADLGRGIDSSHFVSQVFKLADVRAPEPPVSNMMLFGEMVHWNTGKSVELPVLTEALPECKNSLDTLQPGDRIIFQTEAANSGDKESRLSTGIYVGKCKTASREIQHGVVLCSAKSGRAALVELASPEFQDTYRFALRGWTYRAKENETDPPIPGKALPPNVDRGRTLIAYKLDDPKNPGKLREVTVTAAQYFGRPAQEVGRVRIIAVGIDEYPGEPKFNGSDNSRSARALYQMFVTLYGDERCDLDESEVLTSEKMTGPKAYPTRDVVEAAIRRAADKSQPDDMLVIYLAGHGEGDRLHTMDAGLDGNEGQGISLTGLVEELAVSGQGKVILLADYGSAEVPRSAADRLKDVGKDVILIASASPTGERPTDLDFSSKLESTFRDLRTASSLAPPKGNGPGPAGVESLIPVTAEDLFKQLRERLPDIVTYSPTPKSVLFRKSPGAAE